ncbi:hypothetical protein EJB05_15691, partial [Eragrostis curvula]
MTVRDLVLMNSFEFSEKNNNYDIDECTRPKEYLCYGICINYPGTFGCNCPNGNYGNSFTNGGCRSVKDSHIDIG